MSIPLKCPKCLGEFKAKDALAGKRVKCPKCGQGIEVPGPSFTPSEPRPFELPKLNVPAFADDPGIDDQRSRFAETAAAETPVDEPAWSTPNWDDAEDEEVEEDDPSMPFPDAPVPFQPAAPVRSGNSVEFGFGTIADYAMDPRLINFSLQWSGALVVANIVSLLLLKFGFWWASLPLSVLAIIVYAVGVVPGISFMVSHRLQMGETPPTAEGWNFFFRRWMTILFGIGSVCLAVVIVAGIVAVILWAISHAPTVGTYLGAILIIPAFVFLLFTMSLFFNLYLMPIVVGVEDCTALSAFGILRRLVSKNGIALYGRYFSALAAIAPFAIFSLVITGTCLFGAVMLTGGENLMSLDLTTFDNLLRSIFVSAIVLTYVAFLVVFASVSFTLIYCESRRLVHVDR